MQKTIISLLIVAIIGGGVYYYSQNVNKVIKKEVKTTEIVSPVKTDTDAVWDEDGKKYENAAAARAAGLSDTQFGATYSPEYIMAKKIKAEQENLENKLAIPDTIHINYGEDTVCDWNGKLYFNQQAAREVGLSETQFGATLCPWYKNLEAVCTGDGRAFRNAAEAKKAGLKDSEFGATYCPKMR